MIEDIDTAYALSTGRKTYLQPNIDDYDRWKEMGRRARAPFDSKEKPNLLSSEVDDGMHMPVIDCDYPIQAIPSSTPGHYHLYIDERLTWEQYKTLLDGFLAAGLIQKAWYESAIRDKRSYVRLPNVRKKPVPGGQPDPMTDPDPMAYAMPSPQLLAAQPVTAQPRPLPPRQRGSVGGKLARVFRP